MVRHCQQPSHHNSTNSSNSIEFVWWAWYQIHLFAFTIVYHWLSKMTPINFQKRYFFFLWPAYLDSCFNYAWSRSAKMLIPRLNFIDLKQPSIKIDTIADTASHSVIARKKGQPTTISSGHSNSQSVSLSLSALKPCLSDVLCAIDIEWMMRHISKQPAQSIQSMIHSHWNVYLRCVCSHFFFLFCFCCVAPLLLAI